MNEIKQETQAVHLLKLIVAFRKPIALFCISAIVGALIFTLPFFIPPVYKSEVIFYPPSTSSNKILIQYDVRFGTDKEIDQHTQMLKSSLIKDSVIKKYNLLEHYGINKNKSTWRNDLYQEYDEKITIDRTRYNALSVSVLDTEPELAAKIANDIVIISDALKATILRKNLQAALRNLEMDYNKKVKEFDVFADNINRIVKDKYIESLNIKNQSFVDHMKNQIDVIRELSNSGQNYNLKQQYNYESMLAQLAELQSSYEQASSNLNNNFPTCYVISPAHANYKKDAPNRSIIVLIAALTAFLLSVIYLLLSEQFFSLKKELEK